MHRHRELRFDALALGSATRPRAGCASQKTWTSGRRIIIRVLVPDGHVWEVAFNPGFASLG